MAGACAGPLIPATLPGCSLFAVALCKHTSSVLPATTRHTSSFTSAGVLPPRLLAGMLTGKYTMDDPASLPSGPRGLVFRQVLPGLEPLLRVMGEIAARRRKTLSQVAINWCMCQVRGPAPMPLPCRLCLWFLPRCLLAGHAMQDGPAASLCRALCPFQEPRT